MKRVIVILVATLMLAALMVSACAKSAEPAYPPVPVPTPAPAPSIPDRDTGVQPSPPLDEGSINDRLIVRTGNLSLMVEDVSLTLEQIGGLADRLGGYVVTSNQWREGDRVRGIISIRVPAQHFQSTMFNLEGMAVEVLQRTTTSRDVTEEYTDLNSRLRNLEAAEKQLLQLMERATDVSDVLNVQRELTFVRGEIEQIKGRMQYLEMTTDTSLIDVSLVQSRLDVTFSASRRSVQAGESILFRAEVAGGFYPYSYRWELGDGSTSTEESPLHVYNSPGIYSVSVTVTDDRGNLASDVREAYISISPSWNPGDVAGSAWKGLITFGRGLANIAIWLGIFSPVWIIIGAVIYWLSRRRKKRAK